MTSAVSRVPIAESGVARHHFAGRLSLETDCADVQAAFAAGETDFVLLDVRGADAYARGHVPGALNLPHREITAERMAAWAPGTLFVTYCAGPHCNGGDRGALRLAELGRPVKLMIGGVAGWADEGFAFATGVEPGRLDASPPVTPV